MRILLIIYVTHINPKDSKLMESEFLTWLFVIAGVLLMLGEIVLPGGVAFFLGLSGVLVAALRFLGFLGDPVTAVTVWLLGSLGLVVAIRPIFMKYFEGDSSFTSADEDLNSMDEVVRVEEPVNEYDSSGRIRYQGASWNARTLEGTIPKGARAVIKYRDNVTWIVEPYDEYIASDETLQGEEPTGDESGAQAKKQKQPGSKNRS